MGKLDFGLYFITDRALSRSGVISDAKAAIRAGVRIVQYREKSLARERMIAEAREIAGLCKKANVTFIVNDYIDVAVASAADGLHIGPCDMPLAEARKTLGDGKIIGVTAGSVADALRFERAGADYIGLSPIFATATKKDAGQPVGLDAIREASKRLRIPFVAIGGINRENLTSVLDAGAKSVCMISAILKSGGIEKEVREIRGIINEHAARKGKK
ncbi:MAG: thiamine phosphate synthase [Candidatus Aenigmarchaeota archaeon]|nr:thiamine phosphate synthase [Candidatus Aenigmarchaeota archaeon]